MGDVTWTAGSASVVSCRMVSTGSEAAEPVTCTGHRPAPTAPEAESVNSEVSPDDTAGGSNFALTPGGSPVADRSIRATAPATTRVDTRAVVVPPALSRAKAGSAASAKSARGATAKARSTSWSRRLPSASVAWRRSDPKEVSGAAVRSAVACQSASVSRETVAGRHVWPSSNESER